MNVKSSSISCLLLIWGLNFTSIIFAQDGAVNPGGMYRQEFEQLKKNSIYQPIFDKEYHQDLKDIHRDIENFKELSLSARMIRFIFLINGRNGIVVTSTSMPKLYSYVECLCKEYGIKMPTVFISSDEGFFNVFAQKLFTSTGGILIGQKIINEMDDEILEAVIAHEIGHIKHNHINKLLCIHLVCNLIYQSIIYQSMIGKLKKNGENFFNDNPKLISLISKVAVGCMSQLIIGKKFEREADEFACKSVKKTQGLINFFKYVEKMEQKTDSDFARIADHVQTSYPELKSNFDRFALYSFYHFISFKHAFHKGVRWVYHNTRLGPHPSHQERIKNAEKYLSVISSE